MKNKFCFIMVFGAMCGLNILFAQFMQQGPKLVGTGNSGNSAQGISCAISSDGNTAVIGGWVDNSNVGAVWVFIRSSGVWTQQGSKLIGTGASGIAYQGKSVAISADGNTIAVGGYSDSLGIGAIWVFTRSGGVWTQQGPKLVGTGSVGANVLQGTSVAISSDGNTIVEGGTWDNGNAGAIWVFTRTGSVWSQQGSKLVGTGATGPANQGSSVDISGDGNTIVAGGFLDNGGIGAFWVFTRSAGIWTQLGSKLSGTGNVGASNQGSSISISSDGNTIVTGGGRDNNFTGAIWVFTRSGNVWSQQGTKLVGTGSAGSPFQGSSVSISSDGNVIVEGGYFDNTGIGAVWAFTRTSSIWTQLGSKLIGTGASGPANQGTSVALSSDGSTVLVGAYDDHGNLGAAWVFVNSSIGITPVSNEVPASYSMSQNFPNPFNPQTSFEFWIPESGFVSFKIFDVNGREVETLVKENLSAGIYRADWNASKYSSGVYFYRIETKEFSGTKKMILVK